jgi:hypothetical protein
MPISNIKTYFLTYFLLKIFRKYLTQLDKSIHKSIHDFKKLKKNYFKTRNQPKTNFFSKFTYVL